MKLRHARCLGTALSWGISATVGAFGQTAAPPDLTQASLEDLMNIEVTSVSRKEQKLSKTGAAIFVITQDDIVRSGAMNIPDVLRIVPGVNVARVDANSWAISIRGFNSQYSNKILVLLDGRYMSSPYFSGVNWDQVDVPLQDIERIEVIRGPGGTAWGTNAMNGVINIITMNSKDTQGGLIVGQVGSQESEGLVQYGGKAGSAGTYRAFGKYSNTDSSVDASGAPAADGWHVFRGGFRFDFQTSPRDTVMVQGDVFKTAEGQTLTEVLSNQLPAMATFNSPLTVSSADLQVRWNHTLQNGSDTSLNVYYSDVKRVDEATIDDSSFDIDFEHHIALNSRNDIVWGLGYLATSDAIGPGGNSRWFPPQRTDSLFSAFAQDEITLTKSLWLTIGTKLEHNSYTGFEYEPSAQFVWAPTDRQTVWLSASQAIRQPSRQDTDLQYDAAIVPLAGGNFGVVTYFGNKNIHAEELRDYEMGYRAQISKRLSLDLSLFRGYYRHLETSVAAAPFFTTIAGPPRFIIPLSLEDTAHARTYGGELSATWQVNSRWRLSPGFSLDHIRVIEFPPNPGSAASMIPGASPEHQIELRSGFRLRSNLDWDTSLYFVGRLEGSPFVAGSQIPAYTRLDTQLRWRVLESLEFNITGQNLLTPIHPEFANTFRTDFTEVQRSVLGGFTWRF